MHVPPTENLKVVRHAEGFGHSAREWESALSAVDWLEAAHQRGAGRAIKFGRKGSVWRAPLALGSGKGARTVACVLKVEPLGSVWKRTKALFGWTKAARQWRGAETLERYRISAATCLAVLRSPEAELLVLAHHAGETLLERMAKPMPIAEERALVALVAGHFSAQWRAGVWLEDPKPSNLLIDPTAGTGVRVLDTVGAGHDDDDGFDVLESALDTLTLMYVEPLGCRIPPRRALRMRYLKAMPRLPFGKKHDSARQQRKLAWREAARSVALHVDPTPENDPLAPPPPPGAEQPPTQ